jgi:hypothetical protein
MEAHAINIIYIYFEKLAMSTTVTTLVITESRSKFVTS